MAVMAPPLPLPTAPPSDVKVWDIVAELVHICTEPCPPNPFDVDLDYFAALPTAERFLASGAMVGFLRQLLAGSRHAFDRRGKTLFHHCAHDNVLLLTTQFVCMLSLENALLLCRQCSVLSDLVKCVAFSSVLFTCSVARCSEDLPHPLSSNGRTDS